MKRLFFILTVIVLSVSLFAVSVFGASDKVFLDYNDYLKSVIVQGDQDLVKFGFPLSTFKCDTYNYNTKQYLTIKNGAQMTATLVAGNQYRITFYSPYMLINNIPDNTWISASFELSLSNYLGSNNALLNVGMSYFDRNGDFITQVNGSMREVAVNSTTYTDTIVTRDIADAYGVQIFYQFNYYVVENSAQATITLLDNNFSCSISSIYRENMLENKNNQLLGAIEEQLQANGDKLDDIINGSVDSVQPDGSGSIGDLNDAENGVIEDAQAGIDQAETLFNNAPGIVALYATGFYFMSNVLEHFIGVGWLSGVVSVSLALGLLAFIINISVAVIKKGERGSK